MKRLAALALLLAGCASNTSDSGASFNPAAAQSGPILKIGALINQDPLGDPDTQAALQLAQQDVNAYLASSGDPRRIALNVQGTGDNPDRAVAALGTLESAGVQIVVGPETSSEVAALMPQVARSGTILLSHCATSSSLAKPGDNVFRLTPSSETEVAAIGQLMQTAGVQAALIVYRDDLFGNDLRSQVKATLQQQNVQILGELAIPTEGADYSALAAQALALVQPAVTSLGAARVAVQLDAFGPEAAGLLAAVSGQAPLDGLRWFGSDGTALSREILSDPKAAAVAQQTQLVNPLLGVPQNRKTATISQRIGAASNTTPQICSLTAYDGVWLAAQSLLLASTSPNLARILPQNADNYFGASGWTQLNANGDRASGNYDLWQIVNLNWTVVGNLTEGQ